MQDVRSPLALKQKNGRLLWLRNFCSGTYLLIFADY